MQCFLELNKENKRKQFAATFRHRPMSLSSKVNFIVTEHIYTVQWTNFFFLILLNCIALYYTVPLSIELYIYICALSQKNSPCLIVTSVDVETL